MNRGKLVTTNDPQEVEKALAQVGSTVLLANSKMGCAMALTNTGKGIETKAHCFSTPHPITAKGALSRSAHKEITASGIMPSMACGSHASTKRLVARGAMAAAFSGALFLGMGADNAMAQSLGYNYFGGTNPLGEVVATLSKPAFVDIDHDGDMDCFIGEMEGSIQYWKNNGQAGSPDFMQLTGDANPLTGTRSFMDRPAPTFVDIDGDGDMDCFIGSEYPVTQRLMLEKGDSVQSAVSFVENIGTPQAPVFDWSGVITDTRKTITQNPLLVQSVYCAVPTFVDIDGDGDMDAFVGDYRGYIHGYENVTGEPNKSITSTIAFYAKGLLQDSNGDNIQAYYGYAAPVFMDGDNDGDMDLFVGNRFGLIQYYENTGDNENPEFNERTMDQNPLPVNPGQNSAPAFADINGDGRMDAFFGTSLSIYASKAEDLPHSLTSMNMRYYQNVGTAAKPDFRSRGDNPFNLGPKAFAPNPVLGDVDGDGDLDALVGSDDNFYSFIWLIQGYEGKTDDAKLISKLYGQTLGYYENTGTVSDPVFAAKQGENNPWGDRNWYLPSPAIADLNGDGLNEVYVGHTEENDYLVLSRKQNSFETGVIDAYAYRNISDTRSFESMDVNPFRNLELPIYPSPAFTDIDGDGDLDVFVAGTVGNGYSYNAQIQFFRNVGSAISPTFTLVQGDANPLTGVEGMIYPRLSFADVDGDGDLDAVLTDLPLQAPRKDGMEEPVYPGVRYFKNTGTKTAPVFVEKLEGANPFDVVVDKAIPTGVALADIDNDKDVDAVVGDVFGKVYYFRNIKTVEEANAILKDDDNWLCFVNSAQSETSLWDRLTDSCKQSAQKIKDFFSPS
ncbi:MAG: VCBS repeat-containing protein [Desulfatibacillum sp.]|nr:VCBS repeat-containing protein [Desulfatibacillum sp.]